jgi:hypothetical protein
MALFARSTLASATAVQQIADAAGASADAQMTARAGVSLKAAYQHFNNFANWEFLLTEAPTVLVTAPFSVTGATASANANFLTNLPTAHGVLPDDYVTGPMFAAAARVTATATAAGPVGVIGFAETFNASLISTAASSYTVTANRDFYDIPSDWKQPYSVRLLAAQTTLQPVGRRMYDRSITSEFSVSTPQYYDIFGIGTKGRIRLLRAPSSTDRLQMRYYRRMIYTSDPLDIPEPYEPYLIAWAKWHMLMDKSDGMERGNGWLQFANTGLAQMLKDNIGTPDDNLGFFPGHYGYQLGLGPNQVIPYIDNY